MTTSARALCAAAFLCPLLCRAGSYDTLHAHVGAVREAVRVEVHGPTDAQADPIAPVTSSLCQDDSSECDVWATQGECDSNPSYMHQACRASCGLCMVPEGQRKYCKDDHAMCQTWSQIGECQTNPKFMHQKCPVTCRLCQSADCHDKAGDCEELAKDAGCYTRAGMGEKCAWTCQMCALKNVTACGRDPALQAAATPGTIGAMFRRLVDSPELQGKLTVHSTDPWLITIDDFLTPAEADTILRVGGTNWQRSLAGDGKHEVRTSSTSWCRARCTTDSTIVDIEGRIETLTGVPRDYAEYMQVLRYEPTQYYGRHHDQNSPRASAWGPRMLTWYMYLSDVEEGGGTHFPVLNLTVPPKMGRVALWPSVLDEDPFTRDDRTDHEAQPVVKGVKYGANLWLHMYEFRSKSTRCGNDAYVNNWY